MQRTTLNMLKSRYDYLEEMSVRAGVSKQFLAKMCFKRLYPHLKKKYYSFRNIKYQESASEWELLHISFSAPEKERLISTKNVYKLSFSYLLSLAIDIFLNELVLDLIDDIHRYWIKSVDELSFYFQFNTINGNYLYSYYWGLPENLNHDFNTS
jgi:hypothetical protein